ncbi:MAG TPA: hypothetical protein VHE35_31750 [Kofleriaceae bacterium]|nr:hypothetical protein [Kofleriaceae bacterium]
MPTPVVKPVPTPRPTPSPVAAIPFAARQIWAGRYTCAQGDTALRLRITDVHGDDVDAVFEFSHADSGAAGSFHMSGRYEPGSHRLALTPGAWIQQPYGYESVAISGTVSADGATYAGSIHHPACTTFSVHHR